MTKKFVPDRKNAEDIFGDLEGEIMETPSNTPTKVNDIIQGDRPSITSPEWNDYVMSLFTEDEIFDGYPVAAGLRRVAELVLGPIACSLPVQVFPSDQFRATVVWKIDFVNGQTFGDVADCNPDNTDDAFVVFAMATAATRAEARALRKALRLKKASAEEMTKKDTAQIARQSVVKTTEGEYNDKDVMTSNQTNFIAVKCKQMNIDTEQFFKEIFKINSNRKVSKAEASTAIDKLNEYQTNQSEVPESIKGFKEGWKR